MASSRITTPVVEMAACRGKRHEQKKAMCPCVFYGSKWYQDRPEQSSHRLTTSSSRTTNSVQGLAFHPGLPLAQVCPSPTPANHTQSVTQPRLHYTARPFGPAVTSILCGAFFMPFFGLRTHRPLASKRETVPLVHTLTLGRGLGPATACCWCNCLPSNDLRVVNPSLLALAHVV